MSGDKGSGGAIYIDRLFSCAFWFGTRAVQKPRDCVALRISGFCIVTQDKGSQWSIDHGVRGCHNWLRKVEFHKLAKLEL